MTRLLKNLCAVALAALPLCTQAQVLTRPIAPVLGLIFSPAQIAFAQAPSDLVTACPQPSHAPFWIYAQTERPEGTYMLVAGPAMVFIDAPNINKPVMVPVYGFRDVILYHHNVCTSLWAPNDVFKSPTPMQVPIVRDLATDLIARAQRAYGGRAGLIAALKTQGITPAQADPMMRPALVALGLAP
ncbi:hypothetical protein [Acidocella sp. KAb 2-4]|uniref:hypothetical protein n=1 Tax=Acidocella sp. KAb 2-4 TaxID=2885158 RepID=UPI001D0768AF|nr:hypothetical protein [Acidocella sp. KAb 2-4]MCB5943733.1 hypothetical protein [Acidocella sp. KAb 2-4]